MAQFFSVFIGASSPSVVSVPGVKAGDKVNQVLALSGSVGDVSVDFGSFIPQDGLIYQNAGSVSGLVCLAVIQRST